MPSQDEATGQTDSLEDSLSIGKSKFLLHIYSTCFCCYRLLSRLSQKIKANPDNTILRCEAKTFKAYLEWHVKTFRIKKERAITYFTVSSLAPQSSRAKRTRSEE